MSRLAEIAALRDGWWGEGSRSMSLEAVQIVETLLPEIAQCGTHVALAPHEDGMLVIEWHRGDAEFTVELMRSGQMILTTDDESHDLYDEVEVPADAATLRNFIYGVTA